MVDESRKVRNSDQGLILPPNRVKEIESELISKGLREPQAQTAVRVFQHVVKSHRGPLPPAEDFAAYDAAFPGAAKEILEMAVRQQQHAHYCEKATIDGELHYRLFGMIAAIAVVLVLVIGAIVASIYGQTGLSITLGGAAGLTTLAGAFIKGRRLFEIEPSRNPPESPPKGRPPRKKR